MSATHEGDGFLCPCTLFLVVDVLCVRARTAGAVPVSCGAVATEHLSFARVGHLLNVGLRESATGSCGRMAVKRLDVSDPPRVGEDGSTIDYTLISTIVANSSASGWDKHTLYEQVRGQNGTILTTIL